MDKIGEQWSAREIDFGAPAIDPNFAQRRYRFANGPVQIGSYDLYGLVLAGSNLITSYPSHRWPSGAEPSRNGTERTRSGPVRFFFIN
jgi:hypothetical protein